jgi:hypothetical protein
MLHLNLVKYAHVLIPADMAKQGAAASQVPLTVQERGIPAKNNFEI